VGSRFTFDRATLLLLLFLLMGVAAPTAAVLWFMNAAATSEAAAASQSVIEAYRGQLRFLRDRVDSYWRARAAALDSKAGKQTPEDFARFITDKNADSTIFLRVDGAYAYPTVPEALSADPAANRADWRTAQTLEQQHSWQAAVGAYTVIAKSEPDVSLAARAAQGQIRCLLQLNRGAAANAILEYFAAGRLTNATDLQGRLIAADEHLLALRLMRPEDRLRPEDRRRAAVLRRLTGWVNDYKLPMPSAQRIFLINELRAAVAGGASAPEAFPTYDAEELAAEVLEAESIRAGAGLEATRVVGVWKLTANSGRVVALLRTATVMDSMRAALQEADSTGGGSFSAIPPGAKQPDEKHINDAIAAGPMLPGWQIGFTLRDDRQIAEAARRRTTSIVAAGYAIIGSLCIIGVLLGQAFRRQMRLTRLRTDLVAAVSHELKTPVASMRLLVDALLEDEAPDAIKTREYLELIAGENLRLSRLIENFLAFSRIERRRQQFDFTDTDAARVVQTAAAAMRERLGVQVEIDSDLPPVRADEDAMVTVLVNLLDNAYKYTPGDKRVSVRAYREGSSVVFAVEDNGIGIAPREQKRIFRKFYQVDQRLARETGGCGLGLSIVDYIVRAHGGTVRVESRPGTGSTFRVTLPCHKQACPKPAGAAA
jgi:signal transduction histidine kinase